jgi:hypothetical protein
MDASPDLDLVTVAGPLAQTPYVQLTAASMGLPLLPSSSR